MKNEAIIAALTTPNFRSKLKGKLTSLLAGQSTKDMTMIEAHTILTIFNIGNDQVEYYLRQLEEEVEKNNPEGDKQSIDRGR